MGKGNEAYGGPTAERDDGEQKKKKGGSLAAR